MNLGHTVAIATLLNLGILYGETSQIWTSDETGRWDSKLLWNQSEKEVPDLLQVDVQQQLLQLFANSQFELSSWWLYARICCEEFR